MSNQQKYIYDLFRRVREFHRGYPPVFLGDRVVDIDTGLLPSVEAELGSDFRIYVHERYVATKADGRRRVLGWLARGPGCADIYYRDDMTVCGSRWVVTKELAHLLLDHPEDYTLETPNLFAGLISRLPVPLRMQAAMESEDLAYIGALELLIPWSTRGELYRLEASGATALEIAHFYKVPEAWIEGRLSEGYRDLCETMNERISRDLGLVDSDAEFQKAARSK